MSEKAFKTIYEEQISIKDIINLFVESWKKIILTGVLGIISAIAFISIAPKEYQAIAQIQMAQISANYSNNNSATNTTPLGINIEDPALLLSRLKMPTTYSAEELNKCGLESMEGQAEILATIAKFSLVRGVNSLIELKINRGSKELAISCAQSLFENIKKSQNQIIKPYIDESKILLKEYQDRLSKSQLLISRVDKSGAALSAAYLANRDEVKFLTEEILRLNAFITTADTRQAKLVSPIYVTDKQVFPKKKISIIIGFIIGILIGVMLSLKDKIIRL